MANEEHLALLKQGAEVWNKLRREKRAFMLDQIGADLSGADLSRARLSKADLIGVNLSRANLSKADLSRAELTEADLTDVDLTGANLTEVDLTGANLTRAHLIGANLIKADLRWADLSGANLSGAHLHEADLHEANLNEADLRGADLHEANLKEADLRRADLSRADLRGADLNKANLNEADLTKGYLNKANLTGADLTKAYLGEAHLSETIFGNTDLSDVQGLDSCKHNGPSIIDHRTLQRSGPLPLVFLRGVGLPDNLIDYLPSLLNQAIQFYSVFISYSHADKSFARRLYNELQGHGIRCWFDEHQLLPGDDMFDQIDHGIRLWDKILLCCSEASLKRNPWVDREIGKALQKEEALWKERGEKVLALIPLNIDGYLFQWDSGKASVLKERLAGNFTGWEHDNAKFEAEFEKVVRALRADEGGREKPPPSRL